MTLRFSPKFQAKIDEEYEHQKTLEKPEVKDDSRVRVSSSSSLVVHQKEDVLETVPPAPADKLPLTVGGEDKDSVARERRDKVKEVSLAYYYQNFPCGYSYFMFVINEREISRTCILRNNFWRVFHGWFILNGSQKYSY